MKRRQAEGIIATPLVLALLGFGILCGLALSVLIADVPSGGVAPLFSTAIGAGIGAWITLWAANERERKAEHRKLYPQATERLDILKYWRRLIEEIPDTGIDAVTVMILADG